MKDKAKKRKKNGANGRRRVNNTGTLERRGDKWLARWYIELNGKRVRKSEVIKELPDGAGIDAAREWLDKKTKADGVTNADKLRRRRMQELETAEEERLHFLDGLPALSVARAWDVYEKTKAGKKLRDRTRYMYECQLHYFSCWLSQKDCWLSQKDDRKKAKTAHKRPDWIDTHNYTDITEMRAVSVKVARSFSNHLLGKFSADTHNKYISLLSKVWKAIEAKEREEAGGTSADDVAQLRKANSLPPARLVTNPWTAIEKEEVVVHVRRDLTPAEVVKVVAEADGEMRLLFAVGIFTGLRLGDAATLKWSSVNFDANVITVATEKSKRRMADGRTKQKVVCPPLLPPLRKMLEAVPPSARVGYVMPTMAERYTCRADLLTSKIQKVFKRCGIKTQTEAEDGKRAQVDCGYHSFRHSFVSLCAQANIPLAIVQSVVGHSDKRMTEHYLHISQATRNREMAAYAPELCQAFDTIDIEPIETPLLGTTNTPTDATEGRFRSFCAAWDALTTDDERKRALAYVKAIGKRRAK